MDNDPNQNSLNKNDSKGKRLFKKAIRRISKSGSNSQSSSLGGISRSRSVENKAQCSEVNDTTPLPKPDGTKETAIAAGYSKVDDKTVAQKQESHANCGTRSIKSVDIQKNRNVVFRSPTTSTKTSELTAVPELAVKQEHAAEVEGVKRNLKRKLEEESGAATSAPSTGTSDGETDDKNSSKVKRKKNRCAVCGKKVGLTGFLCRCGGLFCAVHRYSDKHDCTFDYKELGAQEIRRNNPVVTSQKIDKI